MTRLARLTVALALALAGCGAETPVLGNLTGTWSCPASNPSCLTWSSSRPVLGKSTGTTSMSLGLSQADGGTAVAFTAQPAEGNGVAWTCPPGTLDGTRLSFGACTLTSGSCAATATPGLTLAAAPMRMAWARYDYTWAGGSCVASGVTVTIEPFELILQ